MEAIDIINNLLITWSIIIISLSYCYYFSSNLPKGIPRLISLLPIFFIFTILPLYNNSTFTTVVTTFFITWLANLKLSLFAFGHAPLSQDPGPGSGPTSLRIFIAMAALPIKIEQTKKYPPIKKRFQMNLAAETLVFAIVSELLHIYQENIQTKSFSLMLLYCVLLFLLIDIIVAVSGYLIRVTVGLEIDDPSNEPYLSTSLQDFWGRRWNLIVTNTLRYSVFYPVKSTLETTFLGQKWARCAGVLSTFVVSGLLHELCYYYLTRESPTWEVSLFFVIHGVCVVLESRMKNKLRLHWLVSGGLTLGFVIVTGLWLFFPPLIRNHIDDILLQEFQVSVKYLMNKITSVFY